MPTICCNILTYNLYVKCYVRGLSAYPKMHKNVINNNNTESWGSPSARSRKCQVPRLKYSTLIDRIETPTLGHRRHWFYLRRPNSPYYRLCHGNITLASHGERWTPRIMNYRWHGALTKITPQRDVVTGTPQIAIKDVVHGRLGTQFPPPMCHAAVE